MVGILKAVERFDQAFGVPFRAFASVWRTARSAATTATALGACGCSAPSRSWPSGCGSSRTRRPREHSHRGPIWRRRQASPSPRCATPTAGPIGRRTNVAVHRLGGLRAASADPAHVPGATGTGVMDPDFPRRWRWTCQPARGVHTCWRGRGRDDRPRARHLAGGDGHFAHTRRRALPWRLSCSPGVCVRPDPREPRSRRRTAGRPRSARRGDLLRAGRGPRRPVGTRVRQAVVAAGPRAPGRGGWHRVHVARPALMRRTAER